MNKEVYTKLEEFKQKTLGWHRTHAAHEMLQEIKSVIPDEEYYPLQVAHLRLRMGEGQTDFLKVVNELISKYRQGPISGPAGKTFL